MNTLGKTVVFTFTQEVSMQILRSSTPYQAENVKCTGMKTDLLGHEFSLTLEPIVKQVRLLLTRTFQPQHYTNGALTHYTNMEEFRNRKKYSIYNYENNG